MTSDAHPAVDAVTPRAVVVLQDRPVVAFNQWMAEVLRACGVSRRGLQIVTSARSRLSLPLRPVLTGPGSLWVVRDGEGYYDGLTGRPLHWDGEAFVPVPDARDYAPGYTTRPAEPLAAQLTLTLRVRRGQAELLGGAVGHLCQALTGRPPLGWGTAEPVTNLWNLEEMTRLFRQRAPRATWLAVVGAGPVVGPEGPGSGPGPNGGTPSTGQGRTMIGTMLFSAVQEGAEEAVTLAVGFPPGDPPPVPALPTLVGAIAAEHRLVSLFAQLGPGRADLTTEPRWAGSPAPIGMAVGPEMGIGPGPADIPGQPIGDPRSPGMWFGLGDGRSPDGWKRYEQLVRHLRAPA